MEILQAPSWLIFAKSTMIAPRFFAASRQETQVATRPLNCKGSIREAKGFSCHQVPNRHAAEGSWVRQVKLPALSKPAFMDLWQPPSYRCIWVGGGGGWEDHAPVTFLPFLLRYGMNKSQGWGQNSQPIKWFMGPAAHSPRTMYFITVNLRTRYNFLSQGAAFKSGHLDSPATT